jgi:hypothetical protein
MSAGAATGFDPAELVPVHILQLPVAMHAEAQEHAEALRREFRLIADQARHHPDESVPHRFVELMEALSTQYGGLNPESEDALDEAMTAGAQSVDLTMRLPRAAAQACRDLAAILDDADAYCREGRLLLTLATPEPLVGYRHWYLDEFVRQLGGEPPRPWPEVAAQYLRDPALPVD